MALPDARTRTLGTFSPLTKDISALTLFVWGGRSDGRIAATGEVWRYFSSMLLHTSLTHLYSNVPTGIAASVALERRYGWWLVAPLYITSGIGANLFSANWEGCAVVVGASGAVLGLCAALLMDVLLAHQSMRLVGSRIAFLIAVTGNLAANATKQTADETSNWSHAGGAITGFACAGMLFPLLTPAGPGMLRESQSPRNSRRSLLRRGAAITLWLLCAAVLVFTFCVLPLKMAGLLHTTLGLPPKHCPCTAWCRCDFKAESGADASAPCIMADAVFGDVSLRKG